MTLKAFENLIAPLSDEQVIALFESVNLKRLTLTNEIKGLDAKKNALRSQVANVSQEAEATIGDIDAAIEDLQKQIDSL